MRESVRGWRADAFRAARRSAGLTQEDLGAIIGCSGTAIGSWESGDYGPQPRHAVRIALALDVDLQDLVDVSADQATIRDLRTWAGLTQSEVRAQEGLGRIGAIERGSRPLPRDKIAVLADMYGATHEAVIKAVERSQAEWRDRVRRRSPR